MAPTLKFFQVSTSLSESTKLHNARHEIIMIKPCTCIRDHVAKLIITDSTTHGKYLHICSSIKNAVLKQQLLHCQKHIRAQRTLTCCMIIADSTRRCAPYRKRLDYVQYTEPYIDGKLQNRNKCTHKVSTVIYPLCTRAPSVSNSIAPTGSTRGNNDMYDVLLTIGVPLLV